jgi:hypothetical protein
MYNTPTQTGPYIYSEIHHVSSLHIHKISVNLISAALISGEIAVQDAEESGA